MKLSKKQQLFALAMAELVIYAYRLGYGLTYDNAYMKKGSNDGRKNTSTHRNRLAVDWNIFVFQFNKYLTHEDADMAFNELHDKWDTLGGAKRIKGDLRHFSFKHRGVR